MKEIKRAYKAWRRGWAPLRPSRADAFEAGVEWAVTSSAFVELVKVEEILLKSQGLATQQLVDSSFEPVDEV